MNDRARAISILRQARDILLRRMTERIVECEEELLDDAHGLSYSGEIDTLYEQLAVRLNHVNVMLSNLPAEEEPSGEAWLSEPGFADPGGGPGLNEVLAQADTSAPGAADTLTSAHEATVLPSAVTFELFARQMLCDDLESAGRSLAVLFAVEEGEGRQCANVFHARLAQSPETMTRLLQLRRELLDGSVDGPLQLLSDCFGLEGLESMSVLQTLRARLIGHNEAA